MANPKAPRFLAACAAGLLLVVQAVPARAADASPWVEDLHSAFRLIAGANKKNSEILRAGIEIKMDTGWHTYWRYSGDSGVPPRFDFSGSKNVASAKVRFPAPHLITDETGNTLGYTDRVILPVEVTAQDKSAPVTLHVKLDYAVCEKMCVPAEGRTDISLVPGATATDTALAAAEARVPQPVAADKLGLTVRRVNNDAKPLIAIDLKSPSGKPVQLFAEGPTPEWALPIPKAAPGAPNGRQQFTFQLDGLPPGVSTKGPFELTFTVVDGERAYEVRTRLD